MIHVSGGAHPAPSTHKEQWECTGTTASKGMKAPLDRMWWRMTQWKSLQPASRQWIRSLGAFTVSYEFGKIEAQWGKAPLLQIKSKMITLPLCLLVYLRFQVWEAQTRVYVMRVLSHWKKTGPETLSTRRIIRLPFSTKRSGMMPWPRQPGNGK